MRILSIALGGCLKAPPIYFGITQDTGGHLTYLWGAAAALSVRHDVEEVEIVTRLIDDPDLGAAYSVREERVSSTLRITRIATQDTAYLSKERAERDRPAFIAALVRELVARPRLPDLVHAHFADAADVAIALRERFGIPFIFTGHSLAIDKRDCDGCADGLEARIALETRAIGEADAIIASSRDEAERQLMRYPSADPAKIHRIAPGAVLTDAAKIGSERARSIVAPFLRDPTRPMLLAIARPVQKKNLAALIDLYAADPALRDSANLVILAGLRNGPDSGEAEQRAVIRGLLDRMDSHGLYGSLALPKQHDQQDVAAMYALARETGGVFVNPALNEPYGLTLTEAAHHGLPVVATSRGGAADIVRELGHGIAADPSDAHAFGKAIRDLLFDRDRWTSASRAGRSHARALSWDNYADRFMSVAGALVRPSVPAVHRAEALLLCDIDHTLTGCRVGAGEFVAQLHRTPRRMFGIATGRSLQEARRILDEWGYPAPAVWVTSVGSEIYWHDDGHLRADQDYAEHLATDWDPDAIERIVGEFPELTPQAAVEQRRFKRSWFAPDGGAAIRVRARLDRSGVKARVVFSHGRFLDVLPIGAGKSGAMRWVAERLGLPLSAVFAAGDSGNDLDMLEACPNAIMVANHSAELAPLIGRPGIHVATRCHAGGIVEILSKIDAARTMEAAA